MAEGAARNGAEQATETRVYAPNAGHKAAYVGMAVFAIGFAAAVVWWALWRPEPFWAVWVKVMLLVIAAGFAVSGLILGVGAFRWATVLSPDAVTAQGLIGDRSLRRADIRGYRVLQPGKSTPSIRFYPGQAGARPLTTGVYGPDDQFLAWLAGLPNLDETEAEQAAEVLMADPRLGADKAARQAAIQRFERVAKAASVIGVAVVFWVFAWPQPYSMAVGAAALAPVAAVALAVWSRGALTLGEKIRTEPRPGLFLLMMCGWALGARALLDVQMLDWRPALATAAGLGGLLLLVAWSVDRRALAKPVNLVVFAGTALLYGWGVVVETDMLADQGRARVYVSHVTAMRISSGKHTAYDATLTPWGPKSEPDEVDVGRAVYERLHVGGDACVRLHPGAFGMRWYQVEECEPETGA